MIKHYFDYNGKRYGYGTIVRMKQGAGDRILTFVHCDMEKGYYYFKFNNDNCRDGCMYISYTKDRFDDCLIEITNTIDTKYIEWHPVQPRSKPTFKDELKIDGMFLAWLWYIVLMAVTLLFNGRILYWAFISSCFFIYRQGKLKEEGFK